MDEIYLLLKFLKKANKEIAEDPLDEKVILMKYITSLIGEVTGDAKKHRHRNSHRGQHQVAEKRLKMKINNKQRADKLQDVQTGYFSCHPATAGISCTVGAIDGVGLSVIFRHHSGFGVAVIRNTSVSRGEAAMELGLVPGVPCGIGHPSCLKCSIQ